MDGVKKRKLNKGTKLIVCPVQLQVKDLRNSGHLLSKTRVSASQVQRHLFRCVDNLFRFQSPGTRDARST